MLLNALSEEYQEMLMKNLIQGENYVSRTDFFLNYMVGHIKNLFQKFPVLEYKVGLKVNNFYEENIEILKRVIEDIPEIVKNGGLDNTCVIEISGTEGDTHNGRSVKIVKFKNNKKIVYKPRSMASDKVIYQTAKYIFSEIEEEIYIPWIIDRGNYSWQEFIEETSFDSENSISEFYFKSGVYMSIFLLLGTCDLHLENIYVKENSPIFADLEVLGLGDSEDNKDFPLYTYNLPQTSILNSYLLPIPSKKDVIQFNASGLFPDTKNSQSMIINEFELNETNEWKFIQKEVKPSITRKLTYQRGKILPEKAEDSIIDGFTKGMEIILNNKRELKTQFEILFKSPIRIRQILRPTVVYAEFIENSNYFEYLKTFKNRDKLFNILLKNFDPGDKGYYRVQDEIKQLKNDDIPSFYMMSNTNHLYNNNGVLIEDYYFKDYFSSLLERLDLLKESDLRRQVRYIRLALAAYYSPAEFFYSNNNRSVVTKNIQSIKDRFLDYIIDNIIESSKDYYEFYSLQIYPFKGKEIMFVEGIEVGLYNSGGIILTLMEHDNEASSHAAKLLYSTLKAKTFAILKEDRNEINIGVFSGIGGLLYLSYYLFKKTNDLEYKQDFIEIQSSIKDQYLKFNTDQIGDSISGDGGLLVLLCNIYRDDNSIVDKDLLELIYSAMEENMKLATDISFSHGKIGECLALISLYKIKPSVKLSSKIFNIMKSIDDNIFKLGQNISWCRGITGYYLLIFEICLVGLDIEGKYLSKLKSLTIEDLNNLLKLDNESLCHGNSGNILILNKITSCFQKETAEYCSNSLATHLANPFNTRWVRGSKYIPESFMLGASGNVYALEIIKKRNYPLIFLLEV